MFLSPKFKDQSSPDKLLVSSSNLLPYNGTSLVPSVSIFDTVCE